MFGFSTSVIISFSFTPPPLPPTPPTPPLPPPLASVHLALTERLNNGDHGCCDGELCLRARFVPSQMQ